MEKTPYEIRLEILKLAKDIHEQKYHSIKEAIYWAKETGSAKWQQTVMPDGLNVNDILKTAKELNEFVSTSKS